MNRRDGFTYAELTVALGIVCILAAILFPVFARAQAKARHAECLNHLLNIGVALRMYAADWHGHFPAADNNLTPLVPNYLPEAAALICPTAQIARSAGPPPWPPRHVLPLPCDYVYRSGLCDDDWPNNMIAADDVSDRHQGVANYLFMDGSARAVSLERPPWRDIRDKYRGLDEIQALRGESVPQPGGPGPPGYGPGPPPYGPGPPPYGPGPPPYGPGPPPYGPGPPVYGPGPPPYGPGPPAGGPGPPPPGRPGP
ncbi:MAG: type II secretion system protein [Armatimonadetes bacterium]|nr:type II secretion system protein [Armatimonadota bacterium]